MAGRKYCRKGSTAPKVEISEPVEENVPKRGNRIKSANFISPNGELRQRLLETVIDVKENIPAECAPSRRITRSSQLKIDSEAGKSRSPSADSRKRRCSQAGPPPKRASIEKMDEYGCEDDDSSYTNSHETSGSSSSTKSSTSCASRVRSVPLPVMEEEDEVFNSSSEQPKDENESANIEESEIHTMSENTSAQERYLDEESLSFDDEEEYEEEEDVRDAPLQNQNFAFMKRHMNDVAPMKAPALMKREKCQGIGPPDELWALMVSRDDLARASKCLLRSHPEMTINMRGMLLDWMMEVCYAENLHRETYHLAADYVDRFLESDMLIVTQETFQLVGTAALFIAAKYEEIYPPKCSDFSSLTDKAFNTDSIRKMEVIMMNALNWTLGPITSVHWLSTYLQFLGQKNTNEGDEHVYESNYFVPELMREDFIHMAKILDYFLSDLESLTFTYRTIAAAVLFACYEPRDAVEKSTGFNYDQLLPVIEYVEPVVTVFEKLRQAGDPFPVNDKINPDDVHNIQSYVKYDTIRLEIEQERAARLSRHSPRSIYSYHPSTHIISNQKLYS